ncbi:MAG: hypothetical protein PVI13_01010 [Desulfobacterales bacterium]|jgi:hypothetical protein
MPPDPKFFYFLYNNPTPIDSNNAVWGQPLPLSRDFSGPEDPISISHGDYFGAVRLFFENQGLEIIYRAADQELQLTVNPEDIREIRIRLEKHGEFYHPARIEVPLGQQSIFFVLNVALSESGTRTINDEFQNLKRLNNDFSLSFLPQVYGFGEVALAAGRKIPMFLGQWFEGYNEFHISRDRTDHSPKIIVWGDTDSQFYVSTEQQSELYRQAARILAYYYNVETLEQIYAWHHAAGDFIVRIENAVVDLKLISVRRYAPLLKTSGRLKSKPPKTEFILQALLLFFLNLSIRMRLDRLDGVGDIIWADSRVVPATLEGFFEGLALKADIPELPDAVNQCFGYYLSLCSKKDLLELAEAVVSGSSPRAPETPIVKQHLDTHVASLYRSIRQFTRPS